MADGNMLAETLRPENTQIQTGSLREPTRPDSEAIPAGLACDLRAHRANELQRQAEAEDARLRSFDFRLYREGLVEMRVHRKDARKAEKELRKDYFSGDLGTRARIANVLSDAMAAISGVRNDPASPGQLEAIEVKVDR